MLISLYISAFFSRIASITFIHCYSHAGPPHANVDWKSQKDSCCLALEESLGREYSIGSGKSKIRTIFEEELPSDESHIAKSTVENAAFTACFTKEDKKARAVAVGSKFLPSSAVRASVLSANASQRVGILLHTLKKSVNGSKVDDVKRALLTCELKKEAITLLSDTIPNAADHQQIRRASDWLEEVRAVQKHLLAHPNSNGDGTGGDLNDEEEFVLFISQVPSLHERLGCMYVMQSFSESVATLSERVQLMCTALSLLSEDPKVAMVFQTLLIVGNKLNEGTVRGGLEWFHVAGLARVLDVRGNGGATIVEYLAPFVGPIFSHADHWRLLARAKELGCVSTFTACRDLLRTALLMTRARQRNGTAGASGCAATRALPTGKGRRADPQLAWEGLELPMPMPTEAIYASAANGPHSVDVIRAPVLEDKLHDKMLDFAQSHDGLLRKLARTWIRAIQQYVIVCHYFCDAESFLPLARRFETSGDLGGAAGGGNDASARFGGAEALGQSEDVLQQLVGFFAAFRTEHRRSGSKLRRHLSLELDERTRECQRRIAAKYAEFYAERDTIRPSSEAIEQAERSGNLEIYEHFEKSDPDLPGNDENANKICNVNAGGNARTIKNIETVQKKIIQECAPSSQDPSASAISSSASCIASHERSPHDPHHDKQQDRGALSNGDVRTSADRAFPRITSHSNTPFRPEGAAGFTLKSVMRTAMERPTPARLSAADSVLRPSRPLLSPDSESRSTAVFHTGSSGGKTGKRSENAIGKATEKESEKECEKESEKGNALVQHAEGLKLGPVGVPGTLGVSSIGMVDERTDGAKGMIDAGIPTAPKGLHFRPEGRFAKAGQSRNAGLRLNRIRSLAEKMNPENLRGSSGFASLVTRPAAPPGDSNRSPGFSGVGGAEGGGAGESDLLLGILQPRLPPSRTPLVRRPRSSIGAAFMFARDLNANNVPKND